MTKQLFLDNVYLLLNKVRTLQGPGYDPSEIALFATEAQELLVTLKYTPTSNNLKEGFEETEKRIQDLGNLISNKVITPTAHGADNMPNGVFVNLPNSLPLYTDIFWFTVFEQAITDIPYCGDFKRVNVYEINHNEYAQLLNDPFNKPDPTAVWRMRFGGNRHELITDGTFNITSYHVRYIRKPLPIDLTTAPLTAQVSELADNVHRELVRMTVNLLIADTENTTRLQIDNSGRKE